MEVFNWHKFKLSFINSGYRVPCSKTPGKYAAKLKRFLYDIYFIGPLSIKIPTTDNDWRNADSSKNHSSRCVMNK